MSTSVAVAISETTIRHLNSLPSADADRDLDRKIQRLLEAEYRRQLSRYNLMDRRFRQKYGMTFDEFEAQDVEKQRGYTWEVESDAMAWETAIDGRRTMERRLVEVRREPSRRLWEDSCGIAQQPYAESM